MVQNNITGARVARNPKDLARSNVEGVVLKRRPNPKARRKARREGWGLDNSVLRNDSGRA